MSKDASPPARKQTSRATLFIRKLDGPNFATRRHDRTCCLYPKEENPLPPRGGAAGAGNISRGWRTTTPRNAAAAPAPSLRYLILRIPKSATSAKKSTPPPHASPAAGRDEAAEQKKIRKSFSEKRSSPKAEKGSSKQRGSAPEKKVSRSHAQIVFFLLSECAYMKGGVSHPKRTTLTPG